MRSTIALLLLALLTTTPAYADEKPSIEALIGRLGDSSFRVRAAASKALLERGKPALAPLRKLIATGKNLETRARAKDVVLAILKRLYPDGGTIHAGLQAVLKPTKERFAHGEAIRIAFRIRNVSDKPIAIRPISRQLELRLPWTDRHVTGAQALMRIKQLSGQRVFGMRSSESDGGSRRGKEPKPITIAAGKHWSFMIDFTKVLFDPTGGQLQHGVYAVTVTYHAERKGMVKGATRPLDSNTAKITVLPKSK